MTERNNTTEEPSDKQAESADSTSKQEPIALRDVVGRRTAMGAVVTALGLAGLTGQVSGQSDIGTASNPYRRLYVSQGVVFTGITSSSGLPEGTLHVRSDQV